MAGGYRAQVRGMQDARHRKLGVSTARDRWMSFHEAIVVETANAIILAGKHYWPIRPHNT